MSQVNLMGLHASWGPDTLGNPLDCLFCSLVLFLFVMILLWMMFPEIFLCCMSLVGSLFLLCLAFPHDVFRMLAAVWIRSIVCLGNMLWPFSKLKCIGLA